MDYKKHSNLETWFLNQPQSSFPGNEDLVSVYKTLKEKLYPIHKQVTSGADSTDGTSLTWHDSSHIQTVLDKASDLLKYKNAEITSFEAFILLVAIQLHDIMNSDGRDEHENRAIEILSILKIDGIIDSITKRTISDIIACHSGTFRRGENKERDKIGFLLEPQYQLKAQTVRPQFLAALLRLADEYSDNDARAMSYLLTINKISAQSIIHHKYAQCLHDVYLKPNSGIAAFDFHVQVDDAVQMFDKYIKEKSTVEQIYLIDEIFSRTMKSHYETIYCMRYLRPSIVIDKISVKIEIEVKDMTNRLRTTYELLEKGYPTDSQNIYDLCGTQLTLNGGLWSGLNLKDYIKKHNIQ